MHLASWSALAAYLGFLASQIALHVLLPGQQKLGMALRDGRRLKYKFTGMCWLLGEIKLGMMHSERT